MWSFSLQSTHLRLVFTSDGVGVGVGVGVGIGVGVGVGVVSALMT